MGSFLFYLFAALTLLFALGVVLNRNPVSSALCLVVSFLGLASLFIQLDAFFIGIIQILVYAGAVMVLFLFIIMLLDLKAEKAIKPSYPAIAGGVAVTVLFVVQLGFVLDEFKGKEFPALGIAAAAEKRAQSLPEDQAGADAALAALRKDKLPDVHLVGETIFTRYYFLLQIVGVLLLVATVGVVILSKRRLT